jgi:peptidoglycan/LPS O-acetylase OafA/YrhL
VIGFTLALSQRLFGLVGAPGFFAILTALPANLFMLPNVFVPWGIFLFNPPAWSLFYELVANAVYAIGVRAYEGRNSRSENAGRNVDMPFGRALVGLCLVSFAGLILSVVYSGNLDRGVALKDWPIALSRVFFSFTLGILLHRGRSAWMTHTPRLPLSCLLFACPALFIPELIGSSRAVYDLIFVSVMCPALIMLTAVIEPHPSLEKIAVWLGMISFPLYAVHAPVKHVMEAYLPSNFAPLLLISTCSTILIAWVVGSVIDPVLRRWLTIRFENLNLARSSSAILPSNVSGKT